MKDAEAKDPFVCLIERVSRALSENLGIDELKAWRLLLQPIKEEYGDLGFPLMRYVKGRRLDAIEILNDIMTRLKNSGIDYVNIELVSGFMNFRLNIPESFKRLVFLMKKGWRPRPEVCSEAKRIVVEHTSANPIHPLHMGHARNSILGDTLSRLLKARGHRVNRRFYIDDVGRQVAIAVLGFELLNIKNPKMLSEELRIKPDHLAGWIYATTHTAMDVVKAKNDGKSKELEELAYSLARLEEREPVGGWTEKILNSISLVDDPEKLISRLINRYERGLEPERTIVRTVSEFVLEGFKETLKRLKIEFDHWDWESDLVWNDLVSEILDRAKKSKYYMIHKGVEAINIPEIIKEIVLKDKDMKKNFKIPRNLEVPPLILVRSDGTTLYTTRDIAYTIKKFREFSADKVINVVGAEQRLPQLQIRLALLGLGFRKEALNLIHYDYEMVRLVGMKMSGRRGVYMALDNIFDEVKARAKEEVLKRNPNESLEWIDSVAEAVALGAIRFSMIQSSASKPLTFDPEKALNFKENSGPYLQYTYARSVGILEKVGEIRWNLIDYEGCKDPMRRRLIVNAMKFPMIAAKAADDLAPEDLATYLLKLSDSFNAWYQRDPVIRESNEGIKYCKVAMVKFISETVKKGLELLGIPPLRRM